MGKKQVEDNPTGGQAEKETEDHYPVSTLLKRVELANLKSIQAQNPGLTRSSLLRYAWRYWWEAYRKGEAELPIKKKEVNELDMD